MPSFAIQTAAKNEEIHLELAYLSLGPKNKVSTWLHFNQAESHEPSQTEPHFDPLDYVEPGGV